MLVATEAQPQSNLWTVAWGEDLEDRTRRADLVPTRVEQQVKPGSVVMDTSSARVTMDGKLIDLTALEYRMLEYLMQHAGEVISKTELTEHIYDQDFDRDSNVIEVLINRLRSKVCADMIKTRRGLGYQLVATPPDA